LLTSSAINVLDIPHWEKAVGNLDENEIGISKHSVGSREREAISRSIKLSANGKNFTVLSDYLEDALSNSASDIDVFNQRK
jgi:hypothetical protein